MADTLTLTNSIPVKKAGDGGGSGGTSSVGFMYVTLTRVQSEETGDYDFYIDKSYNELREAIDSGKLIISKEIIDAEDTGVGGFQFNLLNYLAHQSLDSEVPYLAGFGNIEVFAADPDELMNYVSGGSN